MKLQTLYTQWKFPLFVSVLLSLLFMYCFVNTAVVELDISVSQRTFFKVYWSEDGQVFSEKKMSNIRVRPKINHYSFFLTDLRKIQTLRIDPQQYVGESIIQKIVIKQKGFHPLNFTKDGDFAQLDPIFDVARAQLLPQGFVVESTGVDPQFKYQVDLQKSSPHYLQTSVYILTLFIFVFCFFYLTKEIRQETVFIPLLFSAAFIVVLVMATISRYNVHPDERVHFDATHYYMTNWLPPAADDPAIRDSYSVYGVSRLNNFEAAYFFSGKFSQLLAPFQLPDYLRLRLFNVLLFGVIVLCLLRYAELRLLAAPLLLTSQLWYVFSYCNSDAFALFVTFLVCWQVVLPRSMLNTWLRGENTHYSVMKLVLFGFVCALLLLLKKNYYFFIVFLFGYLGWKTIFHYQQGQVITFYKRIALVVLLGLCLAGLRVGMSYMVNGFDRSSTMTEMREELADYIYKPSTSLEYTHSNLYHRAQGRTLKDLIKVDHWLDKTFHSTFGVYGYFTVSASIWYYRVVGWVGSIFLMFCVLSVLVRGGIAGNLLLTCFFCCAAGLIGASMWHSWTADFQAQGRYLFPIIPMLSIVMYHIRTFLPSAGYRLLMLSMFMLAMYSFVFVALLNIPKV